MPRGRRDSRIRTTVRAVVINEAVNAIPTPTFVNGSGCRVAPRRPRRSGPRKAREKASHSCVWARGRLCSPVGATELRRVPGESWRCGRFSIPRSDADRAYHPRSTGSGCTARFEPARVHHNACPNEPRRRRRPRLRLPASPPPAWGANRRPRRLHCDRRTLQFFRLRRSPRGPALS